VSAPEKRILADVYEAQGFVRALLDRARIEVEDMVAEDFKEARRLAPDGVSSDDMVIAVVKRLREWKP
jgi:hypothetical protein